MTRPFRLLVLLLSLCSLSFAENRYLEAGFPAADHTWTDADYTKTSELIQEKKLPLPSLRNDESSALFWRMVNSLNFDRLQDKEYPTLARFQTYLAIEKALAAILSAYVTEFENGAALATELDHIFAATLYLTRHAVLLVEELLPQLPKDSTYEKRMNALKKIRTGIVQQFSEAEESLDEKHASKDRSYIVLLTAIYDSICVAKRALKDDSRTELQLRFQKRLPEFKNPKSRELLQGIIRELTPDPDYFRDMQMSQPSLWP